MAELFNIYCDESCHLAGDHFNVMVFGSVVCKFQLVRRIKERLQEIKKKHGLPPAVEIKWMKVSNSKCQMYLDIIDYFFDDDNLQFRGVLVPDKAKLNHAAFQQTHDDFYYKMCFRMIEPIIDPTQRYRIYLDIKDTQSESRRAKLEEYLRTSRNDLHGRIVERVQQIRSHESPLMQLADLITGAISYHNRRLATNAAKIEVIRRIQRRAGISLDTTTWLRHPKISLLRCQAQEAAL